MITSPRKHHFLTLLLAWGVLFPAGSALSLGAGPIGLWPASDRYILVADKHFSGLVLVDLELGSAVERLKIDGKPRGVASCSSCDFAMVTGDNNKFWMIEFKGKVAELLATDRKLGLDQAVIKKIDLMHGKQIVTDGRMILFSDDGESAFIASSRNRAVYRQDFVTAPQVRVLLQDRKAKPYGLNWTKEGELLVAMHKRQVWRIATDGGVLATYDVSDANCPGARDLNPNLRAAVDDPLNSGSLLILASNPKSYDAVIWRLHIDEAGEQSCTTLAGMIGREPGWTDGEGDSVEFSRPHYFVVRSADHPFQLVISDIDNSALRILNLDTASTATVMYDRDLRNQSHSSPAAVSSISCEQQHWSVSIPAVSPSGTASCARPASSHGMELTLDEARAHCAMQGARLCEPVELRQTGVAKKMTAWTRAECASCWRRNPGDLCADPIVTHRTAGVHRDEGFSQGWHSGQALEIGATSASVAATVCLPIDNALRAATPCCADSL